MKKIFSVNLVSAISAVAVLFASTNLAYAGSLTGSTLRVDNTRFNTGQTAAGTSLSGSTLQVNTVGQSLSGGATLSGSTLTLTPGASGQTSTTTTTSSTGGAGGYVPPGAAPTNYVVPNVSNLNTPGPINTSVNPTFTWVLPTGPSLQYPIAQVLVVRSESSYPLTPTSDTVVSNSVGTSFTDTGTVAGKNYYYTVFVKDTQGNYSSGALTFASKKEETPKTPVKETTKKPSTTTQPSTPSTPSTPTKPEPEPEKTPEPEIIEAVPLPLPEEITPASETRLESVKRNINIYSLLKVETESPESIGDVSTSFRRTINQSDYFRWLADSFGMTKYQGYADPNNFISINLASKDDNIDWDLISGYEAQITIPAFSVPDDVVSLTFTFKGETLLFQKNLDATAWIVQFPVDPSTDLREALVQGVFSDNTQATLNYIVKTVDSGMVVDDRSGEAAGVEQAMVRLDMVNADGTETPYHPNIAGYANPEITSSDPKNLGGYIFIVTDNGDYRLVVKAKGYRTYVGDKITPENRYINNKIVLEAYPWWYLILTILIIILVLAGLFALWWFLIHKRKNKKDINAQDSLSTYKST